MIDAPALVEFAPVGLGPFELTRVTVSGVLHALALLASIGLSVGIARRRGLLPRLVVETHVLAVPVALLLSRARALAGDFPAFLHDTGLLARILLAPPDLLGAAVGATALVGGMAWASGRPVDLADTLSSGAVLIGCAMTIDVGRPWDARSLALIAAFATGSALAWRLARAGRRPGEAALVAAEALVLAAATMRIGETGRPSLILVGHAILLGTILAAHVFLRARPVPAASGARG